MKEDQPFRFLDLSRELRDMVYDNLRESKEYPTNRDIEDDVGVSATCEAGNLSQRIVLLFATSPTMLTICELSY